MTACRVEGPNLLAASSFCAGGCPRNANARCRLGTSLFVALRRSWRGTSANAAGSGALTFAAGGRRLAATEFNRS